MAPHAGLLYTVVINVLRFVLHTFYRRIELRGTENIPDDAPVILAGMHPNGLVDGLLVACTCGRPLSFVVKAPLLRIPVVGWLLRKLHAVGVNRRNDQAAGQAANNDEAFRGMRDLLRRNGAMIIFPEGISHNESDIQELRTGFARAAIAALRSEEGAPTPIERVYVVPVGLNYLNKNELRTDVFVEFGKPLVVEATTVADAVAGGKEFDLAHQLRDTLGDRLREVTLTAPSWTHIHLLSLARKLYMEDGSAELTPHETIDVMRKFVEQYNKAASNDPEVQAIRPDLELYGAQLAVLRMSDNEVVTTHTRFLLLRLLFTLLVVWPLAAPGLIVYAPLAFVSRWVSKKLAAGYRDQIAHYRMMVGLLLSIFMLVVAFSIAFLRYNVVTAALAVTALFVAGNISIRLRPMRLTLATCKRLVFSQFLDINELRARRADLKKRIVAVTDKYLDDGLRAKLRAPRPVGGLASSLLSSSPSS